MFDHRSELESILFVEGCFQWTIGGRQKMPDVFFFLFVLR